MKHTIEDVEEVFRPIVLSIVIETEEELKDICGALHVLPTNDEADALVHSLEEEIGKLPD